jgi:hypothetical protein
MKYSTRSLQNAPAGEPLDEVDSDVHMHAECAFHFFLMHESAEEIGKVGAQCKDMIRSYAGISDAYMHQIGDLDRRKDSNPHPFDEEVLPVILDWLKQHNKS